MISDECELCEEFATRICPALSRSQSRFLYESSEFLVFPSLGSLAEGHLLLCPRVHVPSCAGLDDHQLRKLQKLLSTVTRIVGHHYAAPVVFEHGMATCWRRAGGCIDHAHLHVVPGPINLLSVLKEHFQTEGLPRWLDLGSWKDRPYLLVQSPDGPAQVCEAPDYLPSQFLRRHAANELGIPELWDWHNHVGAELIEKTLANLGPEFGEVGGVEGDGVVAS
jgi:diadenosine tetraphosphate (Ap4A) HIT family hydrolase